MFEGFFTIEQIKGTLEQYKKLADMKEQSIANLTSRKQMLEKQGKANKKVTIQEEVKQKQVVAQAEEETKELTRHQAAKVKANQKIQAQLEQFKRSAPDVQVEEVDREALNAGYPEVEYRNEAGEIIEATEEEKSNLNLVIIGHVDSGKSTLSGHILYK